ncbi:MAG TPA: hypothetical protein VGH82_09465 [Gaiellaceae bacterium]|jgi:hypothetical protein
MGAYGLLEDADGSLGDDRASQYFRLCAWNAFALQTIADRLLDADTAADPGTVGYVPRETLAFARACYDQVPDWLYLARGMRSDPDPRVADRLPARLPLWEHYEPTRASELRGLQDAFEALQARTETKVNALSGTDRVCAELRHLCAQMRADADYAEQVGVRGSGPVERGEARSHLLSALHRAFMLGQLLALPSLVEVERVEQDHEEDLPLSESPSWLQIGPGWAVVDSGGTRVGVVVRVLGDRATGVFDGLDIAAGVESAGRRVSPKEIAAIRRGEIQLSA